MTFILLLLLQFSAFAQKDSTKSKNTPIYSLADKKTKGTPTIRLRPTRFLVYQSLASSSNAKAQKEFSDAIDRSRDQVTQSNVIPIGILNADVEITADGKEKKKDFVLMASPIQKDIFQANVQFQLSPKLLQTNLDNQIESIEISFDGGDNWKSYKYEEQLINYQFSKIGEQDIGFRINSKKGTFVTFTTVDVKQLARPSFVEPKRVSAPAVKGGRVAGNVNGAEYRIHMGCDGLFDKPIIIAEGFDAGQNINLDDLTARYFEPLELYRNNGYDLVLVNYDNGRTWIQDNAQVLKAVINQVNATKVGNNKLIVIGESMSGLVARYALKQMENAGQNHNVSHFVAFDTPMKGANVPPGLIALRRWAPYSIFPVSNLLSFLNDVFDAFPAVHAIDEPAAKQMLLTQQGSTPAPEFFQFQTEINNLGYPSQNGIKNIALINGALDGSPQRRYIAQYNSNGTYSEIDQGQLNQGDRILDYSIWSIFDVVAWTHRINQQSYIAFGNSPIAIWVPAARFYLTSPINHDLHPGGRVTSTTGSVYTSFGFVPTFSSIDYRGTLNNDNDYYLNIRNFRNGNNQVTNSALTPFAAIYGDDANDSHAKPIFERVAFNTFGITELDMVNNGCIGCSAGSGGLWGTYYNNETLTVNGNTRIQTDVVNFSSDEGLPILPNQGFPTSGISARWEGSVEAPITGTYSFNVRTDDGTRVWFDGVLKWDDWGYYGPTNHPFQVYLTPGERKNVKIEWKQGQGGYMAKFLWGFNGVESFVPACRLFSTSFVPSGGCTFTVSASANSSSVGCGGSSLLSAGCSGTGCAGVTYSWSGNGNNYNGSPVQVTLPNVNGVVNYTLTGSKAGCANQTASTSVTVSGCGGGVTTLTNNNCYTIQSKNNNQYMQLMGDNSVQKQAANNASNQLWKAVASGNSFQLVSQSNQQAIKCDSYNFGQLLSVGSGGNNLWNLESNNGSFRVSSPTNVTWDMQSAGAGAYLQLYGNTSEAFADYRLWNFTSATCTNINPPVGGCSGTGLTANYYSGHDLQGNPLQTLTQSEINITGADYQTISGTSVSGHDVSARWEGQVEAPVSGSYTFNMRTDDGTRVWFDNQSVVNDWGYYGATDHPFTVNMNAGDKKNIKLEWKQAGGGYEAKLFWAYPNQATQIVPTCRLFPTTTNPPNPTTTCASGNFTGNLDGANCGFIWGWTFDYNNLTRTVQVDIFVDGQKVATVDANQSRPDLGTAFGNPAAVPHGYSYYPPSNASWKNGQNHTITARPCGGTQDLAGSPMNVNCAPGSTRIASSVDSDEKSVEVYPNPTDGKVKVGFYLLKEESVWLNLYDSQSRSLQIKDFEGKSGYNLVEIDLQDYPSGAYFINLQSSQKREVMKVMKVN